MIVNPVSIKPVTITCDACHVQTHNAYNIAGPGMMMSLLTICPACLDLLTQAIPEARRIHPSWHPKTKKRDAGGG